MWASSSARNRRGRMGSSKPAARGFDSPIELGESMGGETAILLGFRFRDPGLLRRALTHRSYCNEHGLDATESYERLEFLGDAVLQLVMSAHLYRRFPDADEGRLTKARASLVRDAALARAARRWGLGGRLRVGRGVEESGGREQDSTLAAAVEAVLAAVYLDQGFEAAREFVGVNMMDELAAAGVSGPTPENAKSRLQEYLQGLGRATPVYRVVGREGPDHSPVFTVEAVVDGAAAGVGRGGKKAEAERAAAEAALAALAMAEPGSADDPAHS